MNAEPLVASSYVARTSPDFPQRDWLAADFDISGTCLGLETTRDVAQVNVTAPCAGFHIASSCQGGSDVAGTGVKRGGSTQTRGVDIS